VAAIPPKTNQKLSHNSLAYNKTTQFLATRNLKNKRNQSRVIGQRAKLKIGALNIRGGFLNKKLLILQTLEENNLDILLISETHLQDDSEINQNHFSHFRLFEKHRSTQRGGGVALLIKKELAAEEMAINSKEEIILSKVYFRDLNSTLCSIIVAGIYCTRTKNEDTKDAEIKQTSAHKRAETIQEDLLEKLKNYIGNNVVIGGDFNLIPKYVERKFHKLIAKYKLRRTPALAPTRESKTIDHLLAPEDCILEQYVVDTPKAFTDHNLIVITMEIKGKIERVETTILSKKMALKSITIASRLGLSFDQFLQKFSHKIKRKIKNGVGQRFHNILDHISHLASKHDLFQNFKKEQDTYLKNQWEQMWKKYIPLLRSQFSKQFWGNLDMRTKYHLETGKTAPWNGVLKKDDLSLAYGQEASIKVLEHLCEIFQGTKFSKDDILIPRKAFPGFKLDPGTVMKGTDKALSADLIPNSAFKKPCDPMVICLLNAWFATFISDLSSSKSIPTSLIGRIFLLNKCSPSIPSLSQLRPITILSPFRSMLEEGLFEKLKKFCQSGIGKSQTGFQTGLGTEVNL